MTWTGDQMLGFCLLSGLWPEKYYLADVSIWNIFFFITVDLMIPRKVEEGWKLNVHGLCDVTENDYKMCLQTTIGITLHKKFNSVFSAEQYNLPYYFRRIVTCVICNFYALERKLLILCAVSVFFVLSKNLLSFVGTYWLTCAVACLVEVNFGIG